MNIEKMEFSKLSLTINDEKILDQVDFEFPLNQWLWIQAAGGLGKSSLLQILAGLKMPQEGQFFLNSQAVSEMSFEEILPYRLKMGYSFDLGGLIHNRSMIENLKLSLNYHKLKTRAEADQRALELLTHFKIEKYKDQRPSDVSGSVRKLVILLRSLIHEPQVLLWDDPTMGLQVDTSFKLFELVKDLQKNNHLTSVFVASHDDNIMKHLKAEKIIIDQLKLNHQPLVSVKAVG